MTLHTAPGVTPASPEAWSGPTTEDADEDAFWALTWKERESALDDYYANGDREWPCDANDDAIADALASLLAAEIEAPITDAPATVEAFASSVSDPTKRLPGESIAEFNQRRKAASGLPPTPATPTQTWDPDVIPHFDSGGWPSNEADTAIDRLDCLTAYNLWSNKPPVDAKGRTRGIMICCPIPGHADRKPSASIDLGEGPGGLWCCHRCCQGGDKFDIAAYYFGMPDYKNQFPKLRQLMAEALGIKPRSTTAAAPAEKADTPRANEQRSAALAAARAAVPPITAPHQHDPQVDDERRARIRSEAVERASRDGRAARLQHLRDSFPKPLDWASLAHAPDPVWLIAGLLLVGNQAALVAAAKTGKSLIGLYIAACLAAGRDPFTGQTCPPRRVIYIDMDMTLTDLKMRLTEMGFDFEGDNMGNFFYFLRPQMGPLDTEQGGEWTEVLVELFQPDIIVYDTYCRIVKGKENDSDTTRDFERFTGRFLKTAGVAMLRLDHTGKNGEDGRGSSAKNDDVDTIWSLSKLDSNRADTNLKLKLLGDRSGMCPEQIQLKRIVTPFLAFRRDLALSGWPAGTKKTVADLDAAGVPVDATQRAAADLLKKAGFAATTAVLGKAMAFRKQRASEETTAEYTGDLGTAATDDGQ